MNSEFESALHTPLLLYFYFYSKSRWLENGNSLLTSDPVTFAFLTRGVCRSCQAELESIQLSREEYTQLKDRVMGDVIQGRDVFNKTTPEVWEPLFLSLSPSCPLSLH